MLSILRSVNIAVVIELNTCSNKEKKLQKKSIDQVKMTVKISVFLQIYSHISITWSSKETDCI